MPLCCKRRLSASEECKSERAEENSPSPDPRRGTDFPPSRATLSTLIHLFSPPVEKSSLMAALAAMEEDATESAQWLRLCHRCFNRRRAAEAAPLLPAPARSCPLLGVPPSSASLCTESLGLE